MCYWQRLGTLLNSLRHTRQAPTIKHCPAHKVNSPEVTFLLPTPWLPISLRVIVLYVEALLSLVPCYLSAYYIPSSAHAAPHRYPCSSGLSPAVASAWNVLLSQSAWSNLISFRPLLKSPSCRGLLINLPKTSTLSPTFHIHFPAFFFLLGT